MTRELAIAEVRIDLDALQRPRLLAVRHLLEAYDALAVEMYDTLRTLRALHVDDSYGACVRCYRSGTDDVREPWPCPSVRVIDAALARITRKTRVDGRC
jgi:hypothetical protein